MGICRAKTIDVDLHLEVVVRVTQCLCDTGVTGGMCYSSAVGLSGLNLRSSEVIRSDAMSRQGSVIKSKE